MEGPRITQGVGKEECLGKATAEGLDGAEGKSVRRGLRHLLTGDKGGWPGSSLGLSLLLPHQKPVSRICCYIKNTPHSAV